MDSNRINATLTVRESDNHKHVISGLPSRTISSFAVLQNLLHSKPRGVTLPAVGVSSAFRRPQDTLIPSRH